MNSTFACVSQGDDLADRFSFADAVNIDDVVPEDCVNVRWISFPLPRRSRFTRRRNPELQKADQQYMTNSRRLRRLLFVHETGYQLRGSERCLLDLVTLGRDSALEIHVAAPGAAIREASVARGAFAHALPDLAPSASRFAPSWNLVKACLQVTDAVRPEVVHFVGAAAIKQFVPALWRRRIPSLLHAHLADSRVGRWYSWSYTTNAVVGVSNGISNQFDRSRLGDRLHTIVNAVDFTAIEAAAVVDVRAMLGIPRDAIVIGIVAALAKDKAHEIALRAAAEVAKKGTDCHFVLLGDGPERASLEALASELSIRDRVHFVGFTPVVGSWLRGGIDLLMSTSRAEAMPLNIIEAVGAGLPAIVSNIEGHREALADCTSCLFFEVDSVTGAVDALVTACCGLNARQALARDVDRPLILERHDMARYWERMSALYLSLTRGDYGRRPLLSGLKRTENQNALPTTTSGQS